jgi:hypothetical protein
MSQEIPLDTRQTFRSWAANENKNFRTASRSVGGFALAGFIIGMLAMAAKEHLPALHLSAPWEHYVGMLLEHGGLGLVVSSIAVFGYEWRSHARKAFELSEDLKLSIAEVSQIKNEFQKYTSDAQRRFDEQTHEKRLAREKGDADFELERQEKLAALKAELAALRTREVWETFDLSLTELLGADEKRSRLRNHLRLIVECAFKLKQRQNTNTVQYLNVISWLISETVVENARTLENLSNGTQAEWRYKVPTSSATMAARILGAHMKVLEPRDSYDTISDVRLWENEQLKYFADKTREALGKGVKVRRAFNLCTLDVPKNDGAETTRFLNRINAIIDEHIQLMKTHAGFYSVRFFSMVNAPRVRATTGRKITDIQGANFGLFRNVDPDRIIRFVVEDINLSSMRISYCNPDHADVQLFEAMWGEATEANPFADESGA